MSSIERGDGRGSPGKGPGQGPPGSLPSQRQSPLTYAGLLADFPEYRRGARGRPRHTPDEQGEIEELVKSVVQSCEEDGGALQIAVRPGLKLTQVAIAVSDRPMIATTIQLQAGGPLQFTDSFPRHVIERGGQKIGLCFLEVPVAPELVTPFVEKLRASLSDVVLATDDNLFMSARVLDLAHSIAPKNNEQAQFLSWLDDHIIRCGSVKFSIDPERQVKLVEDSALGICRTQNPYGIELLSRMQSDIEIALNDPRQPLAPGGSPLFRYLGLQSPIRRPSPLLHSAVIEKASANGTGELIVTSSVGFFSTDADVAKVSEKVPVLSPLYDRIVSELAVQDTGYDRRRMSYIFDGMPKGWLVALSHDAIREIFAESLNEKPSVAFGVDEARRYGCACIIVPADHPEADHEGISYRDKLREYFEKFFGAEESSGHVEVESKGGLSKRYYVQVPLPESAELIVDRQSEKEAVRADVSDLLKSFSDHLVDHLDPDLYGKFQGTFDDFNEAGVSPEDTARDIGNLAKLTEQEPVRVALVYDEDNLGDGGQVVVYGRGQETDVDAVTEILRESGVKIAPKGKSNLEVQVNGGPKLFVDRYPIAAADLETLIQRPGFADFDKKVAPSLARVINDQSLGDGLNSLMLSAGLPLRNVEMLRTYGTLLWRLKSTAPDNILLRSITTDKAIVDAIVANPGIAKRFDELMAIRFDPDLMDPSGAEPLNPAARTELFNRLRLAYQKEARGQPPVSRAVFELLLTLLESTRTTNFFQTPLDEIYDNREDVTLQIYGQKLPFLKQPRPHTIDFVFTCAGEAKWGRLGPEARGGERFCDDIRTYFREGGGLELTQDPKNGRIGLDGAKLVFALRERPSDPAKLDAASFDLHCRLHHALASITDNLVLRNKDSRLSWHVVRPERTLAYSLDGELISGGERPFDRAEMKRGLVDPYRVVGPDAKIGIPKYIEAANWINGQHGLFFGKIGAYMSGLAPYSHPGTAITARGTLEALWRHAIDAGLDPDKGLDLFLIGDLKGDVAGGIGAAVRSPKLKGKVAVRAAVNHIEILINPSQSLEELFAAQEFMQREGILWSGYPPEALGAGSVLASRTDTEIYIPDETRRFINPASPLSVPDAMDGSKLVMELLRGRGVHALAPAGIKTYVKARFERIEDLEDPPSDEVVIDAEDVECPIVVEGGNLQVSAAARIVLAKKGIRISDAATDNSAGVALSDAQVNDAIGLYMMEVVYGALKEDQKTQLRAECAAFRETQTVDGNRSYNLMLTDAQRRSSENMAYFRRLISDFETQGAFDRAAKCLPKDEELADRMTDGMGMLRPELAGLAPYVKKEIFRELVESDLISGAMLTPYLEDYFPPAVRNHMKVIGSLHLRRDAIVASAVTNQVVESLGPTFVHELCATYTVSIEAAVKSVIAADRILDIHGKRRALEALDGQLPNEDFWRLRDDLNAAHRALASWLTGLYGRPKRGGTELKSLDEIISRQALAYNSYRASSPAVFGEDERAGIAQVKMAYDGILGRAETTVKDSNQAALSTVKEFVDELADWSRLVSTFELIHVSRNCSSQLNRLASEHRVSDQYDSWKRLAEIRSAVLQATGLDQVLALCEKLNFEKVEENVTKVAATQELRRQISRLTRVLAESEFSSGGFADALPVFSEKLGTSGTELLRLTREFRQPDKQTATNLFSLSQRLAALAPQLTSKP